MRIGFTDTSYGGALGVTTTSGPGVSLKSEAMGLAVMTELPLVIVDVQRGGPSTGLPTKTEQADLLQAMFGRNGESPVAVLAVIEDLTGSGKTVIRSLNAAATKLYELYAIAAGMRHTG